MLGVTIIIIIIIIILFAGVCTLMMACLELRGRLKIWGRYSEAVRYWVVSGRSGPPPASPNFDN